MTVVLFLLYFAIGGAVGYGTFALTAVGLPLSIAGGAITSAVLGQMHVLVAAGRKNKDLGERIDRVEQEARDASERVTVVEARTNAIETTVKHELTERRDALVNEMKHLEGLIERLTRSFDSKLAESSAVQGMPLVEDAILIDVKNALKEARVELHLQPIVGLPQRRVSFYEAFTRLKRADGTLILPAEFLEAARRANLMGVIDNFTLFRCVQIVKRLAARDRRVGVFCNISTSSLEDATFFPLFFEFMAENRDIASSVIFELRADRFETRSKTVIQNMGKLVALGYRFSIDQVSTLGLDLPRLQAGGVRFVKFNGAALVEQLRDPMGSRPISSINRPLNGDEVPSVFRRYDITLIAEKMEDEASVVEVLEYQIPYGQGHVFGAPRPIKSTLSDETQPPPELLRRLAKIT